MNYNRHITFAGTILISALLVSSCDPDKKTMGADPRYISLSVSSESSITTKASGSTPTIELPTADLLSEVGDSLYILGSVTKNTEDHFNRPKTKVTIHTTGSFDSFPVSVYENNNLYGEGIAKPGKDFWSIYYGETKIEWPSDKSTLSFYSHTDGSDTSEYSFDANSKTFSFNAPSDAADIRDFIVAYSETTHNHAEQNLVPVHFYHALSLVKFDVSGDIRINKITIRKVANKGTATINKTHNDFTDFFNWTPDYVNTASYTIIPTNSKGELFVMPQTLKDKPLQITFNITTKNGTFELTTKSKNLGTDEWTAGYVYNYLISDSVEPRVNIDVIDSMSADNKIKSNVKVENTMRSTSFIRAHVIGTWCNDADKVVAPWNGRIDYNTNDWIKIGNYHYYKYPVVGFSSTTNLVDEFKVTDAGEKPQSVYDLHFELRVIAQAVEFDADKKKVETAWGSTVASSLSTNLK